jgi:hypothetical protein
MAERLDTGVKRLMISINCSEKTLVSRRDYLRTGFLVSRELDVIAMN